MALATKMATTPELLNEEIVFDAMASEHAAHGRRGAPDVLVRAAADEAYCGRTPPSLGIAPPNFSATQVTPVCSMVFVSLFRL